MEASRAGRAWDAVILSLAIQHHPLRAESVKPLLERVPGAELVVDPEPDAPVRSPWRTYRECLVRTPREATHRLILQDDVEVCDDFLIHTQRAIEARPDRIVCFHVSGHPATSARRVLRAGERGESWAELDPNTWCPVVATCWPVFEIGPMLRFDDAKHYAAGTVIQRGDDYRVGAFIKETRRTVLATVPSLVEHPDTVGSLIGTHALAGGNPGRVACCYLPEGCDPYEIDWSLGPR